MSTAVGRFWQVLWAAAMGLMILLLSATLADRPSSPEVLRYFPQEVLVQGRIFTQEVRAVSTLGTLASLGTLLLVCFHPGGMALLRRLEALGGRRHWLGLTAVGVGVSVVMTAVLLPFALYTGYWHEKAYGLTRQTLGQWFLDYLLGAGVQLGLTLLFWVPFYSLIRRWPRWWWVPAACLNLALTGLVIMVSPAFLGALEGEMVPLRNPQVLESVQRLASHAGVKVDGVLEMKASEKSTRLNAMVMGLGPTRRVVLYDNLLEQMPFAEVEVVVAHELAHAANHDVARSWLVMALLDAVLLAICAWLLQATVREEPQRLPAVSAPRGLALVLLFFALSGHLMAPVRHMASRQMEVRADRFALEATGNPDAFISAFQKLAAENLGDVDPPRVVEILSHSHPSIINRIRMAERFP